MLAFEYTHYDKAHKMIGETSATQSRHNRNPEVASSLIKKFQNQIFYFAFRY